MPRIPTLTPRESELWLAVRTIGERIVARVDVDVLEATGVSAADYAVLATLLEVGSGRLRQRDLAMALGWDKSRVSHQLSRMQDRTLLVRTKTLEHGSRVEITAHGRSTFARARPVHAAAVRRHLLDGLTAEHAETIIALADRTARGG